jgi:hypothetical protein
MKGNFIQSFQLCKTPTFGSVEPSHVASALAEPVKTTLVVALFLTIAIPIGRD